MVLSVIACLRSTENIPYSVGLVPLVRLVQTALSLRIKLIVFFHAGGLYVILDLIFGFAFGRPMVSILFGGLDI
jgi:hypothetical protein